MSRLEVSSELQAPQIATTPAVSIAPSGPALANQAVLDAFSRTAGPDVTIKTALGMQRLYAVFEVEPGTQRMRVRVIDETGKLVRMIPPSSVSEMIQAMGSYRGLNP